MKIPSYDEVLQALTSANANSSPSESHGMLCGIICGFGNKKEDSFLNEFLQIKAPDDSAQILVTLYNSTEHQLRNSDFEFQLLLPDENSLIEDRVDSLREWCQGFLIGLETVSFQPAADQSIEVTEAIKDLGEFAVMEHLPSEKEGDAEEAISEIIEFIRVAILLFYTEYVMMSKQPDDTTVH